MASKVFVVRENRQVAEFIKRRVRFVTDLEQIDLGNEPIGDDGLCFLLENLESLQNDSLQVLIIRGCNITDRGVQRLCEVLPKARVGTHLQKLFLSSNYIGDGGARMIGEALKYNNTLQLLTLQWNRITPEGGEALYEALKHSNNHTLEALALHTGSEFRKETNTVTKELQDRFDVLLKPENRITRKR